MRQGAVAMAVVIFVCARGALAAQTCNQIELAPSSESSVSLLLPATAIDLKPTVMVRNARDSGAADAWGPCPTTAPFGACAPAVHADVTTVAPRKVLDPDDGMQLLAFQMKNASKSTKRDVRLCVQYGGIP